MRRPHHTSARVRRRRAAACLLVALVAGAAVTLVVTRSGPTPAPRAAAVVPPSGPALPSEGAAVAPPPASALPREDSAAPAPTDQPAPAPAGTVDTGAVESDDDPAPAADEADGAPTTTGVRYDVERDVVTLFDPTRWTPARGDEPAAEGRSLRTVLVRPVGTEGRLPLIVFAHGFDSEPEVYERLLDSWAAAGYLVAAPELPGSARDLPGEPTEDIDQQARDISFVITSLLANGVGADSGEIAVAGHSDGGSAVATLALDGAFTDSRIGAYLVLSGAIPDDVDGDWATGVGSGAMLVTVGEEDEYGDFPAARELYDRAAMPKALLTVPGSGHLGLYIVSSSVDDRVRATTVRFLDGVLRHDRDALRDLRVTTQSGLVS